MLFGNLYPHLEDSMLCGYGARAVGEEEELTVHHQNLFGSFNTLCRLIVAVLRNLSRGKFLGRLRLRDFAFVSSHIPIVAVMISA